MKRLYTSALHNTYQNIVTDNNGSGGCGGGDDHTTTNNTITLAVATFMDIIFLTHRHLHIALPVDR
jgi:hypothetical protein